MDGHTACTSLSVLDNRGEDGSDMGKHTTGESPMKIDGSSAPWEGESEVGACKEACGTSTAADSPPETSPVVPLDRTLPASKVGAQAAEGEQAVAGLTTCSHSALPEQQLPPCALPAFSSDPHEKGPADTVASPVAALAVEAPGKPEEPIESRANSLLRTSGQMASQAWESARTHAVAAASATATSVATTDFSGLKEATAKPLLAAVGYIGLGSFLDVPSLDSEEKTLCKGAKSGDDPTRAKGASETGNSKIEGGSPTGTEASATNSDGSTSPGGLLGRLRLPAVTKWLCAANVGCDRQLSCTVTVADADTELEGSEAEAAASEHMARVNGTSVHADAAAGAGSMQKEDSLQGEYLPTVGSGAFCTPSTPEAQRVVGGCFLDGHKLEKATSGAESGVGRTAMSVEAPMGVQQVLTSLEKTGDTTIACEHSLLPDQDGEEKGVKEESSEAGAPAAAGRLQQGQHQKQKLWASLRSVLATSSRRSVDAVQKAATAAASAAGAATRALDGMVVPLLGNCMHPTTQVHADSQQAGLEEKDCPKRAEGEEVGQEGLRADGEGGEQSQPDQLNSGASQTNSRGLLTELQRRQQALAEAVRNRSTNFLQHSVALTASSTLSEARYHLAEIVDTGGPEVSGVWAGVKVGLGIATLASGHLILGGAMVAVATSSLGSALLWGRHRQEVYEIMRGDYVGDADPSQAAEGSSTAEGNAEESEGSEMLSSTAVEGTDSCAASVPLPSASLSPCDASEDGDVTDSSRVTVRKELTGPEGDGGVRALE
ncbi:hypothetical protein, conserved [Eimeria praecox]|uniref:Uncharacterized protein n=1 Tax=Eimeria praecox TaxID=51316 RepID=U6G4S8_9EIME|nr:hypothetical protein, conserved [Eimeria praecox]